MAIESRVRELDSKHRDLDQKIRSATLQPAADWREISEMKRLKLRIKEELEGLRRRAKAH